MMANNKLIIAAAGSGKTTYLVNEALKQRGGKVLITTFTEANEAEIRKKIIEVNKCIPENIIVQTWFSFLLEHGAKPFQGVLFKKEITGMLLVNEQSGLKYRTKMGAPVYFKEEDEFEKHYFTSGHRIYSDKLSKFVVRCDEKSTGSVLERLSKIFTHIFIDEVQDLAGYDLDFLKLLLSSPITTLLVGDPRQGTYSTNNTRKNSKYKKSQIVHFFEDSSIQIETDTTSFKINYRCIDPICNLSNRLYPEFDTVVSGSNYSVSKAGVYCIKKSDVSKYLEKYNAVQLRWDKRVSVDNLHLAMNYGESKGLTFSRTIIYPTTTLLAWLNNKIIPSPTSRAKIYVAITRAKYSICFVSDYPISNFPMYNFE